MAITPTPVQTGSPPPSTWDILRLYLRLGCTCFGGPLAHIGIFRSEFVTKRHWLDDAAFADLLALCQILPGPTSSQLGFLIGWQRARLRGALAAWLGFTTPSLAVMIAAGVLWSHLDLPGMGSVLHGVAIAVLAIVVMAVRGMATTLCRGWRPAGIAVASAIAALALPEQWAQFAALAVAALLGWAWLRLKPTADVPAAAPTIAVPGTNLVMACLGILVIATVAAGWTADLDAPAQAAAACFRAGALVFGGGHVVLPLLQTPLVGSGAMDASRFLGGYGITQMMPGPLFTFAGFVGASVGSSTVMAVLGGLLCAVAIFLPGLTLALAGLRVHGALRTRPGAAATLAGLAAGSVGLLAAACVHPLGGEALRGWGDVGLFGLAIAMLFLRVPPWALVIAMAGISVGLGRIHTDR
jgi:chromate transporter